MNYSYKTPISEIFDDSKIVVTLVITLSNIFVFVISPLFIPVHILIGIVAITIISLVISKFVAPVVNKSYTDFAYHELESLVKDLQFEVRSVNTTQKTLQKTIKKQYVSVEALKEINEHNEQVIERLRKSQEVLRENENELARLLLES